MPYTRITRDEYTIQQHTGPRYGWEDVCTEDTRQEAIARLREYRENQPEYPARITKRRVRYCEAHQSTFAYNHTCPSCAYEADL